MLYHVTIGNRSFRVQLEGGAARVDDVEFNDVELASAHGTPIRHLLVDGESTTVAAHADGEAWAMLVDGWPVRAEVVDERTRAIRAMTARTGASNAPKPVRAPMPGLIVRVEVAVGDAIRVGQGVVAMEAMKMENELKSESAGVVSRILVEPGQAVEKGAVLVELEASAS